MILDNISIILYIHLPTSILRAIRSRVRHQSKTSTVYVCLYQAINVLLLDTGFLFREKQNKYKTVDMKKKIKPYKLYKYIICYEYITSVNIFYLIT